MHATERVDPLMSAALSIDVNESDLMSKPAITIRPHQSLVDAAYLMASHGVHALPVVGAEQQLLGILTTTDIIGSTLDALTPAPLPPT